MPLSASITAAALLLSMPTAKQDRFAYPESKRLDLVEKLHGIEIPDPYRWLEDPDDAETQDWIAAQNKLTFGYLAAIPARKPIGERLTKLWNYERFSTPFKRADKYFWFKNDGLQAQSVLYWAPSLKAKPKVLIDPNKLSEDGTVALSGSEVSEDGKYLAYSVSSGGSDWQEWRVRSVATGKDLKDVVRWSKFSGASWTHDGKGFFYSRYDEPPKGKELESSNYYHKLYYHRLGTPQSKDTLVYQRKDQKEWGFDGTVTDDGRYLIVSVWHGTNPENRVFYKDLKRKNAKVIELLPVADAAYGFVGNDGPVFWFLTDLKAPLRRLIAIDIRKPDRKHWKTVIPTSKDTLESVSAVGGKLVAGYLRDASARIAVFSKAGKLEREVKLPGLGSAGGFGGKWTDDETFYWFTSFSYPVTVFRYDLKSFQSSSVFVPKVQFDPEKYETKQVFYRSKDGTRVPMFLTHKKGIALDGSNPTLLYGYGGFQIPLTPGFSVANLVWMEMGGVFAMANLRGGGEYGKSWHDAGRLKNKQNVFDDFFAAAQWLVANRYTDSGKLAIHGGSNGGLLVGACITQRPELFGAALCDVGVLDMLRFHKWTIGWAWVSDYGSPDKKPDFEVLRKYSPYHNLKEGSRYPATLISTGDHDDRVYPAHSFKFAAALQRAQAGEAPVLIRIETRAGHGAGKPTQKIIDEIADQFSFLVKNLGVELPDSFGK